MGLTQEALAERSDVTTQFWVIEALFIRVFSYGVFPVYPSASQMYPAHQDMCL